MNFPHKFSLFILLFPFSKQDDGIGYVYKIKMNTLNASMQGLLHLSSSWATGRQPPPKYTWKLSHLQINVFTGLVEVEFLSNKQKEADKVRSKYGSYYWQHNKSCGVICNLNSLGCKLQDDIMYLYVRVSEWSQVLEEYVVGALLPWEGIVLGNYQPPNRQAERGRKPPIWVFAYESSKEFPHLLCDSWTMRIWDSSLLGTTEGMWNIVMYGWCCRILSSENNAITIFITETVATCKRHPGSGTHILSIDKKEDGDGEGC